MHTTIDRAGRVVVPKRVRDALGLRGGEKLEVDEEDGEIRLRRARPDVELVRTDRGLLTASKGPGLGPDEVRALLERTRR